MSNIEGKVWGKTSPLFNKNNVEIHRLEAVKGGRCSIHSHAHKFNCFLVETNSILVEVWKSYGLIDKTILKAGQMTTIPPVQKHIFTSLEYNTVVYVIYWTEIDANDIARDDSGSIINLDTKPTKKR